MHLIMQNLEVKIYVV